MRHSHRLYLTAAIVIVFAGTAFVIARGSLSRPARAAQNEQAPEPFVCPMHPDVRQDHPGRCPICGMALEKVPASQQKTAHGEAHGARAAAANPSRPSAPRPAAGANPEARAPVTIDGRRQQLIGVRMVMVTEQALTHELRAKGIVRFDESRWTDVNVRTEGWIRKLYVERTGGVVRRGQPLLAIYSPELATAQAEYLLALRTRDRMAGGEASTGQTDRLVDAARQRLARWDLPDDHLAALTEHREVAPLITFRSPVAGIVMEKRAVDGMRVMPGESLYRIVDASIVWVEADVYESDVAMVGIGQRAAVTLEAWPGDTFTGRVSWIAPTMDEGTRTAKVRIELPNRGGRLKPGMFAQAALLTSVPKGPVIPADALLDTGGRQFVFVTDGNGYFEPRQIRTGQRVDGQVRVLEGLRIGEQVASSATFFVDSESQMRAALEGYKAQPAGAVAAQVAASSTALDVALTSDPNPPRPGMTRFEASVATRDGVPVTDATVILVLYMPPMPSMNMPAMRTEAALGHGGTGVYRGTLDVMMAGRWEATVTVTRGTERLASKQSTLMVR